MSKLTIPANYSALMDPSQTELGIKFIKDFFQQSLASALRLRRVTAPLFVLSGTGINDDLSGTERPVRFAIRDMGDAKAEIVHSLAKWKRMTLADYAVAPGFGIYTDMNAIRADEELDNLHSMYVDQWDWEAVIRPEDRSVDFLKQVVTRIYNAVLQTEYMVCERFPAIRPILPREITFIHSEELRRLYPDKSPKERENLITKKYGAVFIIGIGGGLGDGKPHDLRAPDYDDWSTVDPATGLAGLNGDIMLWYPVLDTAMELSSMGIRVDGSAMLRQLELTGQQQRKELFFHRRLLDGELPLSIGGGIGQSRLCMFLLRKGHVGEIQASIWPEEMRQECRRLGMPLI
ncbi:MAG: aspartate--ammonia ligase [Bacteroidales bacterium]|nr:aspartate--ammonia ligase [Bacteroidales bacterium]MBO7487142.1 aspartate--ammonia ligase [Bacteroidales bacterium]